MSRLYYSPPSSCHPINLLQLLLRFSAALLFAAVVSHALSPDGLSLLALKAAVSEDPSSSLAEWSEDDDDPCMWPGISCANVTGYAFPRVVGIAMSGKNLSGYIPSELGGLLFLRRLNLHGNRLSGAVPLALFNASSLHSIFLYDNRLSGQFPAAACDLPRLQNLDLSRNSLSGVLPLELRGCRQLQRLVLSQNRFSGQIPSGIWLEMGSLVQLDFSSNEFNGSIPPDLGKLRSLSGTLNLSRNGFSGKIPSELGSLPPTVSIDLRYNNLSGEIPTTGSLANQEPTSFLDNPGLCGSPLQILCDEREAGASPTRSPAGSQSGVERQPATGASLPEAGRGRLRTGLVVLVSLSDAAGVAVVGLVLVYAYWKMKDQEECCGKLRDRQQPRWFRCGGAENGEDSCEYTTSTSEEEEEESSVPGGGGGGEGELVAMDKGFVVQLEELLRASAYVLGKGGSGIVYKVVVGNGMAMAVRRLGDGVACGGTQQRCLKEFAGEARAMGRVRHPNVARLRAYYWAHDERLLISDFVPNGNLVTALRGRPGQPSLHWSLRLRIAKGAARGLAHLHDCRFVHGAVKPSNVLLDADHNPLLSDFNLHRLLSITSPAAASSSSSSHYAAGSTGSLGLPSAKPALSANPYRAPELRAAGAAARPTQKSDVYSLGLVLLEMLTGKAPETSAPSPSSSLSTSSPAPAPEQVPELVRWVRKAFEDARPLSDLVDPALIHARKEVVAVFHVALSCTVTDPETRPRMKIVSENLDKIGP